MKRQIDEMRAARSVGLISDELLVETVVATIGQHSSEAFALGIEQTYIKAHTFVQQSAHTVALKNISYLRIIDDILQIVYEIWLARLKPVGYIGLLTMTDHLVVDTRIEESLILQLLSQVTTRDFGLQRVVEHWRLTQRAQGAIYPFGGIAA